MDWQTLIVELLTGQDQVFGFLSDALDPTCSLITPHRYKSERPLTDAQVVLVHLSPLVSADGLHPVQFACVEEGLGGSVTAAVILDVVVPFILVQRIRSTRANVAFDKGAEAVIPFRELAGSVVSGKCLMTKQKTDSQSEENPESSHYPAVLE